LRAFAPGPPAPPAFTGAGGTHPGVEQHAEIGETVAADIKEVMGW
jgi:hypothetical protein